jgi:hypothetical protein
MKLKVQFARSQGWSPKVRAASATDRRVTGMMSAVRPALVPSVAFRRIQILEPHEIFAVVPGRPEANVISHPMI